AGPAPAAARRPRVQDLPWLEVDGERYPLMSAMTVLGRDESADVVLDDPGISRRHAEVRVTNDGPHQVAHLRDLGSTNGSYVNGEQVDACPLHDGDRITVGRTSVIFRLARR
ncbi:FHA domain-containing protein, partial [Janibacter melonis]|uniref:FHA domain-containing protein n=1 Tax=Janibacter melonis TaxID=262209 RepID=UPI00174E5380